MNKELTIRQVVTPEVVSVISNVAAAAALSTSEKAQIVRKMLFAVENGFPLSLAVTGGLYIPGKAGKVEIEARPLRNRIANDPNYHIETVELTPQMCTMQMWRKASDLWPYKELHKDKKEGDWILIGETTFTMEDAKRIQMYSGGSQESLAERDTYKNFPERMLSYRCTSKLVALYGDGIFRSPVYFRGEIEPSANDSILTIEGESND